MYQQHSIILAFFYTLYLQANCFQKGSNKQPNHQNKWWPFMFLHNTDILQLLVLYDFVNIYVLIAWGTKKTTQKHFLAPLVLWPLTRLENVLTFWQEYPAVSRLQSLKRWVRERSLAWWLRSYHCYPLHPPKWEFAHTHVQWCVCDMTCFV